MATEQPAGQNSMNMIKSYLIALNVSGVFTTQTHRDSVEM